MDGASRPEDADSDVAATMEQSFLFREFLFGNRILRTPFPLSSFYGYNVSVRIVHGKGGHWHYVPDGRLCKVFVYSRGH